MSLYRVIVIGGGAAGFFGAIQCSEANPAAEVILLEASGSLLAKVRVSGGGRCNVTHSCFEPRELVKRYPRGGRELMGAFTRWQPRDTIEWFRNQGVDLKTEEDGRMFPTTDDSQTIVDCLLRAARVGRVSIRTHHTVTGLDRLPAGQGFRVLISNAEPITCDRVLIATGGNRASAGFAIAAALGHKVEKPVPSLFTFNIKDPRLEDIAGLSVPLAAVTVATPKLQEQGPLLVTHWGLSGPAILKLSAWGARALSECDYKFKIRVNWNANFTAEAVRNVLATARNESPKRQVTTYNAFGLPARLWEKLVAAAGIPADTIWTRTSNQALATLAAQVSAAEFVVEGKSTNKEEFVTCGGVSLREVDFKTMQSRLCPGVHFAGEALDIDGVTGGFNFQAAWTTGYLAGQAMATPVDLEESRTVS